VVKCRCKCKAKAKASAGATSERTRAVAVVRGTAGAVCERQKGATSERRCKCRAKASAARGLYEGGASARRRRARCAGGTGARRPREAEGRARQKGAGKRFITSTLNSSGGAAPLLLLAGAEAGLAGRGASARGGGRGRGASSFARSAPPMFSPHACASH
jgi:hypothetical protein